MYKLPFSVYFFKHKKDKTKSHLVQALVYSLYLSGKSLSGKLERQPHPTLVAGSCRSGVSQTECGRVTVTWPSCSLLGVFPNQAADTYRR